MTGTEAAWVPWAIGAMGGVGSYLANRGGTEKLTGYPFDEARLGSPSMADIGPLETLQEAVQNLDRLGAVNAQFAAQPISLEGASVQHPGGYAGGGMPVPIQLSGIDPALTRPELLFRGGVDWGGKGAEPPFYDTDKGKDIYRYAQQPGSPGPRLGGALSGLEEMKNALGMLGADEDDSGTWMFHGARGISNLPRLRAKAGTDVPAYPTIPEPPDIPPEYPIPGQENPNA